MLRPALAPFTASVGISCLSVHLQFKEEEWMLLKVWVDEAGTGEIQAKRA